LSGREAPGVLTFLSVVLLGALVYLVWRIGDQLPDLVFRLGEIQRDIAELRRQLEHTGNDGPPPSPR
jgi:hypothetical protein